MLCILTDTSQIAERLKPSNMATKHDCIVPKKSMYTFATVFLCLHVFSSEIIVVQMLKYRNHMVLL